MLLNEKLQLIQGQLVQTRANIYQLQQRELVLVNQEALCKEVLNDNIKVSGGQIKEKENKENVTSSGINKT